MQNRRWVILANDGYRYEYVDETMARSAHAARAWFKRKWEGHYTTKDFKVTQADA